MKHIVTLIVLISIVGCESNVDADKPIKYSSTYNLKIDGCIGLLAEEIKSGEIKLKTDAGLELIRNDVTATIQENDKQIKIEILGEPNQHRNIEKYFIELGGLISRKCMQEKT